MISVTPSLRQLFGRTLPFILGQGRVSFPNLSGLMWKGKLLKTMREPIVQVWTENILSVFGANRHRFSNLDIVVNPEIVIVFDQKSIFLSFVDTFFLFPLLCPTEWTV